MLGALRCSVKTPLGITTGGRFGMDSGRIIYLWCPCQYEQLCGANLIYIWPPSKLLFDKVKCLPAMWETGFDLWVRKILWRRRWQPTPVPLPGKSHGWRSLICYSPWGCRESDKTEWLHFWVFFFLSANKWIKKIWCMYIMGYYSAIIKNEMLWFAARWMDLEGFPAGSVVKNLPA